ncbi:S41 family peptidase [Peptostreptococcus porci]|uniref:S41 family peptidase n=1 Tax=Peptostreptococcus porci TaxID=2652282 RepID=UPI002A8045A1|nr:S41 family peptidase [Peptostreptococcus porci]MDY4127504.1 S41 family peptidase [Peptostreptococcus porci]
MNSDKKKNIIKSIALVVASSILTTFVITQFGFGRIIPSSEYKKYKKMLMLSDVIERDFYKKTDESKLETGLYKGLFSGLDDEYSSYYTKEEMSQLIESTSGKYKGVGIVVGPDKPSGAIKVQQVINGSPASKSGVKAGDLIIKVNGKAYSYQEMDVAVKNMRGEEGTSVTVTFSRDGELFDKKIERKEIKLESIKSKKIDNDIGYIQIVGFDEGTDEDFNKALDSLEKSKIKGLVIDVRDNGGGYLDVVEKIADRLLGESVIVYTKDNTGKKVYSKSNDKQKVDVPIVILTNGNSASASEILTGAILDNKAGVSIGTLTFGKGLVQSVVQLRDGSGYKLTTAQYFTPNGNYINKKGIKPTIEVKEVEKQLPKAVEYLKKEIEKK